MRSRRALQAKRMEEDLLSVASAFSTALHGAVGAFCDAVDAEELPYDTAAAALEKVRPTCMRASLPHGCYHERCRIPESHLADDACIFPVAGRRDGHC